MKSPRRQCRRLALVTLPVVLMLGWAAALEAKPASLQQDTPGPTLSAEVMAEHGPAAAGAQGHTDIPGDTPAGTGGGDAAGTAEGKKDLTVFFSIGIIVDILLVTAFVIWAAGQWSKSKHRN